MSENSEIRGVIPNYYSFIVDKLNKIAEAENAFNYPLALHIAMNLTRYLPRKLKNQINPDVIRIRERQLRELRTSGYFQSSMNRQLHQKEHMIASQEEPVLIDKLTTLLDQEHLLTQSYGIPTRSKSMGDIQKTVDAARYESGVE